MAEAGSTLELHVLALLRARNRAAAPALAVTKAATTLLTECTALEKQLDRERQATDLLVKERHEMVADMELLRQNEANGGVSREHIEQLRDLLEKNKTEAARSASEAAAARASDTSTSEAAQLMAGKLAEAQARAADLEHSLKIAAAREQSLESENARLIERLTVQLQAQAMAMDSERLESGRPCSGCASCAGQSDVHVWCAGDADVHRCPRERTRPCAEHTRTREPRTLASTLTHPRVLCPVSRRDRIRDARARAVRRYRDGRHGAHDRRPPLRAMALLLLYQVSAAAAAAVSGPRATPGAIHTRRGFCTGRPLRLVVASAGRLCVLPLAAAAAPAAARTASAADRTLPRCLATSKAAA